MIRININRDLCIGFGNCVRLAPGVFELDDEDLARAKNPAAEPIHAIRNAERLCPTSAITVSDEDVS